jgi:hypothetical protein
MEHQSVSKLRDTLASDLRPFVRRSSKTSFGAASWAKPCCAFHRGEKSSIKRIAALQRRRHTAGESRLAWESALFNNYGQTNSAFAPLNLFGPKIREDVPWLRLPFFKQSFWEDR